jgi:tripartite-type tricarboxylate transporter receptor subunit TctC
MYCFNRRPACLGTKLVKAARAPGTTARLEEAGMNVTALGSEQFGRGMRDDLARWDRVVKASGFTTRD